MPRAVQTPPVELQGPPRLDRIPDGRTEAGHKLIRETEAQHLALVLYALMDPSRRAYAAVSAGVLRDQRTIRDWARRLRWAERLAGEGEAVQQRAAQLYREHHLGRVGLGPHAAIERRSSIPLLVAGAPPAPEYTGPSETAVRRSAAHPQRDASTGHPTGSTPVQQERDAARADLERTRTVARGAVVRFAQQLQAGKVSVRPADLPGLHRLIRECTEQLGEVAPAGDLAAGLAALAPSTRVQAAERTGGSVVAAMLADAREAAAVLEALAAAEELAAERATALDGPGAEERAAPGPLALADAS